MKKKNIFFDLDGTLIDPKNRYCTIYNTLCNDIGLEPMDCDSYWDLKRKKVSEQDIFKQMNPTISEIEKILDKRVHMLEDEQYLMLDTLHAGAIDFLEIVSKKYNLVLVTFRKNRITLQKQLENLGLTCYFDKVLNGESLSKPKFLGKVELIEKNYTISEKDIFFGDTEVDILAGKHLKLKTIACNFGIRNETILMQLNPDYCINDWNIDIWNTQFSLNFKV